MKDKRTLKVYEAPGDRREVPKIILQGKWLKEAGYEIGDSIEISIDKDQIVIKPVAPTRANAAF